MDVNVKKYVEVLDGAIIVKNVQLLEVIEPKKAQIIQRDNRVYHYIIRTQQPVTVRVRRLAEIFCLRVDPQNKTVLWVVLPQKPSLMARFFSIFKR